MAATYVEFDKKSNFNPKFPKIGLARWAIGAYAFAVWPATEGHRGEMVNDPVSAGLADGARLCNNCARAT